MEEEHRKNERGADKQKEWGSVVEEIEIVSVGFFIFFYLRLRSSADDKVLFRVQAATDASQCG